MFSIWFESMKVVRLTTKNAFIVVSFNYYSLLTLAEKSEDNSYPVILNPGVSVVPIA